MAKREYKRAFGLRRMRFTPAIRAFPDERSCPDDGDNGSFWDVAGVLATAQAHLLAKSNAMSSSVEAIKGR